MFCWIDTVFKDNPQNPDKYFEFYYNLIKDNAKVIKIGTGKPGGNNLVDGHDSLGSIEDEEIDGILKEIADKVHPSEAKKFLEKAGEEPLKDDKKSKQAGSQSGSQILKVKANRVYKRKWESIVRKWTMKAAGDGDWDQWVKVNRRFALLGGDLLLPSENECWHKELNRIKIEFYLDTSGSCSHLAQRFFNVAHSINPVKFDVKLYCFDTQVYEIKNDELNGFGGTSFSIIEQSIQQRVKNGEQYPQSIWLCTDGMGDSVKPEFPDRWHVFLSENYRQCFGKDVNIYDLKDFE
jgi:hypothetical protein